MIGQAGQPWRWLAVPKGMSGNLKKVPVFPSESEPIRPACGQCPVPNPPGTAGRMPCLGSVSLEYGEPGSGNRIEWTVLVPFGRPVERMQSGRRNLELAVDVDGR